MTDAPTDLEIIELMLADEVSFLEDRILFLEQEVKDLQAQLPPRVTRYARAGA